MKKPPVLFIVFNRPHLTRRVFEAIRASRPEVLYVACDGPRESRGETEKTLVHKVRNIVQQVDWPCKVSYKFSDTNLGCGHSVSSAIDWAFEHEDRLIILEDDCLPHQDFFGYCGELLERYKNDLRVECIDGTSLLSTLPKGPVLEPVDSYYFSRIHCVWGWATWKRVWQHYSFKLPSWQQIKEQSLLEHYWATRRNYDHISAHLEMILDGRVDSWDFQLVVSLALQNQLIIHPKHNLIENIGAGRDAHHNKLKTKLNNIKTHEIGWPLVHPKHMVSQSYYDFLIEKSYTHHKIFIKIKSILFPIIKNILN